MSVVLLIPTEPYNPWLAIDIGKSHPVRNMLTLGPLLLSKSSLLFANGNPQSVAIMGLRIRMSDLR